MPMKSPLTLLKPALLAAAAGLATLGFIGLTAHGATPPGATAVPAPAIDSAAPAGAGLQTAVLSGGCFWGVQGVFEHVRGVRQVVAGYTGGAANTASYEMVSTGLTHHAESVQITFDPRQITYGQILRIFFSVATDPTQVNQQYPDEGTQYRSEVWYTSADQQRVASAYIAQLSGSSVFKRPIATRVDPEKGFYPAEAYHQNYLFLHPDQPYIATYDLPKVEALRRAFPAQYQAAPILVASR
jgi:peptide-methionine (S)-S-oxide reductase